MTLLLGCNSTTETSSDLPPNTELIGAWSWDHSTFSNQDTSYVWTDVYGQSIFTEKAYSFIWVNKSGLRDTIPSMTSKMTFNTFTTNELYEVIGSVAAYSGEYKVEGDSMLYNIKVSLWPNLMVEGWLTQKTAMPIISNDTLILKDGNWVDFWIRMK